MVSESLECKILTINSYSFNFCQRTRIGPFIVGIIFSFYLIQLKQYFDRVKTSTLTFKLVDAALWLVSLMLIVGIVFAMYPLYNQQTISNAFVVIYQATSRIFWAIAISYIIFSCVVTDCKRHFAWRSIKMSYCTHFQHCFRIWQLWSTTSCHLNSGCHFRAFRSAPFSSIKRSLPISSTFWRNPSTCKRYTWLFAFQMSKFWRRID